MRPLPLSTVLVRNALLIVGTALLAATLGYAAAGQRPSTNSSQAVTTLTSTNVSLTVEQGYSVNQMIRVTMPGYVASAQDETVIASAARASGAPVGAVRGGLSTTRQPDASVIEWRLTLPEGYDAQAALAAALTQFNTTVETTSPKGPSGKSLVGVIYNRPASPASLSSSPRALIALATGALGGAAALGLIASRSMRRDLIRGRDAIEGGLELPLVGEMRGAAMSRTHALRMAAASMVAHGPPSKVLLLGGVVAPEARDAEQLAATLEELGAPSGVSVVSHQLADQATAREAIDADGVILVLVRGVDTVSSVLPDLRAVQAICPGPLVTLLDRVDVRSPRAEQPPPGTKAAAPS